MNYAQKIQQSACMIKSVLKIFCHFPQNVQKSGNCYIDPFRNVMGRRELRFSLHVRTNMNLPHAYAFLSYSMTRDSFVGILFIGQNRSFHAKTVLGHVTIY